MNVEPAWQSAPESLTLASGEVHVWRARLDLDPAALMPMIERLSLDELARAERFHSSVHRNRFIAAHGNLRVLLARYLGTLPGSLIFSLNAHGKPSLMPVDGAADLRFNLSHSQDAAVFAFALGREVGVDLERIRPSKNERALAKRFFSPSEVGALESLPESEQLRAFFRCWTRKEAYIKARGGGLTIGLTSFSVSLATRAKEILPIVCHDGSDSGQWWLRAFDPGAGFEGAVAAEGPDWSIALWDCRGTGSSRAAANAASRA